MIELLVGKDKVVIDDDNNVICNNAELKRGIERLTLGGYPTIDGPVLLVQCVIFDFGGTIVGDDPAYTWMAKTRKPYLGSPDLIY